MTGRSGQKVSNPEPGGRPTVQQTAGSGDPRRTANLKSGSYSETPHGSPLDYRDSSAISTGVAVLLSAVTTPVRASVQTGEPPNLAREGDPIGLTAEAGAGGTPLAGSARPNHAASPRRPGSRLRAAHDRKVGTEGLQLRTRRETYGPADGGVWRPAPNRQLEIRKLFPARPYHPVPGSRELDASRGGSVPPALHADSAGAQPQRSAPEMHNDVPGTPRDDEIAKHREPGAERPWFVHQMHVSGL